MARTFRTHPLTVRQVSVRRVIDLNPRMRRITVSGPQLGEFTSGDHPQPAFASPGFDDHVKLIFASDGDILGALPTQLEHGIEWPASTTRVARDYTPRRVDLDAGEVDLDFVLHGHGPAAAWARDAAPGDDLHMVGPKSSTVLPPELDWLVLVGDETALPAIGRFLDERPVDLPVQVLVSVSDPVARQELAVRAQDRLTWIVAAPDDPQALADAFGAVDLPDGNGYVWAGAESRALLPVRRELKNVRNLPKDRMNVTGYWHAAARTSAQAAIPSPLPWLATRAAVQLGLLDAVAATPARPLAEVASTLDVPAEPLGLLLPILVRYGLLAGDARELRLGPAGEELAGDEHAAEEFDGLDAELVLALGELAPALRTGQVPWQLRTGSTLLDQITGTEPAGTSARAEELVTELVESSESLSFLLDAALSDEVWARAREVLLLGPGSHVVAEALHRRCHPAQVRVRADPVLTRALQDELTEPASTIWVGENEQVRADLAVAAHALAHRTDAEAAALLGRLRAEAATALIIEAGQPDALGSGGHEVSLRSYARIGRGLRDPDAIAELAGAAGWQVHRVVPLGWGVQATVLR
ncbi:siderophore-interacting protein [Ruania zhangjianzhongii]|uniref:siderophore-interacting protein n=1 Tax=Ruania zhangjianzhongii TaxID=2603206 RepID=UPI0011CBABA7|nr:siderophore-interacting protein [Ruania zhangjianzhongii]